MLIIDTHCDTLLQMLIKNVDFTGNDLQIDFEKLRRANKDGFLQFFAVFESPNNPMEVQKREVSEMIGMFHDVTKEFSMPQVLNRNDLNGNGLMALLSIEGLYFMEGDYTQIDELFNKGVRCISLTWNPNNEFADGISSPSKSGLTEKGRKIVKRAADLGILLDVSHISDKGFWDVKSIMDKEGKPFIASHSNARDLCPHKRNLTDRMLKGLAESNGVSGINVYSCFLTSDCSAGIDDVIRHIEYICALTGPEHVGFGSDFDGIERDKSALSGPDDFNKVINRLLGLNYTENDVKKIAGGNFKRVLTEVLPNS